MRRYNTKQIMKYLQSYNYITEVETHEIKHSFYCYCYKRHFSYRLIDYKLSFRSLVERQQF